MSKRSLTGRLFGLLFLAAVAAGEGRADTWYWDFAAAGDCSSPAKAANWSDVDCWTNASGAKPSAAPSTTSDRAVFNVCAANAGVVYVKLASDVQLAYAGTDIPMSSTATPFSSANRVILFGDCKVTLSPASDAGSGGLIFFCGFNLTKQYVNTTMLCGDVDPTASITVNGYQLDYRMDRYATAAGATRTGAGTRNYISPSYGTYRVYAPASSKTAVTGTWQLTAGSPYATRTSATAHVLSAGTTVTASNGGLPSGTFVKRIFDDATIELSKNATAGGSATLTFAAFSPKVTQTMTTYRRNGTAYYGVQVLMTSPDDSARLEITNFGGSDADTDRQWELVTTSGYYPGTIAVHNTYVPNAQITLGDVHLEFDAPTVAGKVPGFTGVNWIKLKSDKTATMTVPSGISAEISYLTEIKGTLVKNGAGTLTVATTNAASGAYAGALTVAAGTYVPVTGSTLPTVTVKSGATLSFTGEVSAAGITLESGSTISGGTLVSDTAPTVQQNVTFANGASLRVLGGSGEILKTVPTAEAAADPAFWVDFSDPYCFVSNGSARVTLIRDKRGSADDGYMTAAPAGSLYPLYKTWRTPTGKVLGSLVIDHVNTTSTAIQDTRDPLWNKPLANIRAVYMVQYVKDYDYNGGQFLGWTGTDVGDFMRPTQISFLYPLFNVDTCPAKVANGRVYHNGVLTSYKLGYPYQYNESGPESVRSRAPIVTELHTLADCKADSFAHNSNSQGRNGYQIICECLVYTRELTESERVATRAYLMRKWLGCEPFWTRGGSKNRLGTLNASMVFTAASDETLFADSFQGGSVVKRGDGAIYFDDVVAPSGSLVLEEGDATIRSDKLSTNALPQGAYLHLDASDLKTITTNASGRVTKWKDCREESNLSANQWYTSTNPPTLVASSSLNGMPVVDFGPFVTCYDDARKNSPRMAFYRGSAQTESKFGHTAIGLYGTQKGGGQAIGALGAGYNDGYGIFRGEGKGGTASDPLVSTQPGTYLAYGTTIISNSVVARVNGAQIDAFRQGFSGGWDVFSVHTWFNRGLQGMSGGHYGVWSGGQSVAEYLLFSNGLSNVEIEHVEAYLAKKWKGETTAGYREAVIGSLDLSAGTTLTVEGDGALTVGKMTGSGTVYGKIELADDAIIDVYIADDGSVGTLKLDDVDIEKGGTIRLNGDLRKLRKGYHDLVTAPTITAGSPSTWKLVCDDNPYKLSLHMFGSALKLKKELPGMIILFRE